MQSRSILTKLSVLVLVTLFALVGCSYIDKARCFLDPDCEEMPTPEASSSPAGMLTIPSREMLTIGPAPQVNPELRVNLTCDRGLMLTLDPALTLTGGDPYAGTEACANHVAGYAGRQVAGAFRDVFDLRGFTDRGKGPDREVGQGQERLQHYLLQGLFLPTLLSRPAQGWAELGPGKGVARVGLRSPRISQTCAFFSWPGK